MQEVPLRRDLLFLARGFSRRVGVGTWGKCLKVESYQK